MGRILDRLEEWQEKAAQWQERTERIRRAEDKKKLMEILEEQHKTLKELDKVFCDSCGKRKDLTEMKGRCVKCHIHLCNKCAYECNKCKKIFCENHISGYVEESFWGNKHYCRECSSKIKKEKSLNIS